jgi:hypothetical protein
MRDADEIAKKMYPGRYGIVDDETMRFRRETAAEIRAIQDEALEELACLIVGSAASGNIPPLNFNPGQTGLWVDRLIRSLKRGGG